MRTILLAAVVALSTVAVLAPSGASQGEAPGGFTFCNAPGYEDLALVFLNPDLLPAEDGLVHASGQFFIQFQARGAKALEIDRLTFSFGKPVPGAVVCDPQLGPAGMPMTEGAYIKNYRSDNDYRDGFFIPINTYNVGDGEYAAAISVYNVDGVEMVRGWTNAIVENGGRKTGQDLCGGQPPDGPPPTTLNCPDFTKPWPMILPGDGERLDGKTGLYIEVAEAVSDIKVYVNTKLAQLTNASAPDRDDDVAPDICYGPLKSLAQQQCESQVKKKVWGGAWEWDGTVNVEDVVKVVVTDLWGNVAEKVVHIGDPTIGGRVAGGAPEFEIVVDETSKATDDSGKAVFNVTYSIKKDFLHGNVFIRNPADPTGKLPDGITVKANPNHVMDGAGKDIKGTVTFTAGPTAAASTKDYVLAVEYLLGQERIEKTATLKLTVSGKTNGTSDTDFASKFGNAPENIRGAATNSSDKAEAAAAPEDKGFLGLPGPGAFLVAGVATLVALALRRRL